MMHNVAACNVAASKVMVHIVGHAISCEVIARKVTTGNVEVHKVAVHNDAHNDLQSLGMQ